MTDRPALVYALIDAFELIFYGKGGNTWEGERLRRAKVMIARVLAEHETAPHNDSALVLNAASAWLDCAEGRTPGWNGSPSKPIDLVHDLVRALEAAEARCAHLETEHERRRAALKQTADEMSSAVNLSAQFKTPVADRQLVHDWANQLRAALAPSQELKK